MIIKNEVVGLQLILVKNQFLWNLDALKRKTVFSTALPNKHRILLPQTVLQGVVRYLCLFGRAVCHLNNL